jgi:hypothetical protein
MKLTMKLAALATAECYSKILLDCIPEGLQTGPSNLSSEIHAEANRPYAWQRANEAH